MLEIIASPEDYIRRILSLPRPGEDNILAWYEHRLGAIFKIPRLMLMPLDDHLAHRGDGVFESIIYRDGNVLSFDNHLNRMKKSAEAIYMLPPCSWEHVRSTALEVAAAGQERQGSIRILLGRGPGGFGIAPSECPSSSLYIVAYRSSSRPESWYEKGLTGFRTTIPAKQGYLARIKNTNYLPNVLMMHEAEMKKADVPFCFDENGFLAESAIANICLVNKNGQVEIPEFDNLLIGTTLARAMRLMNGVITYHHKRITEEDITNAAEVLMLGTSPGCVSIVSYEDTPIGNGRPGPISAFLRKALNDDIAVDATPIPGFTQ